MTLRSTHNSFLNNANSKLLCAFSFNLHDSSVSFSLGNKVVLVLEAERIFKVKKKKCD